MIKLKFLLLENNSIDAKKLANILNKAYVCIFDVDVETIKSKDLSPPSFVHSYKTVSIYFLYKNNKFLIYHRFFHYKFPREETKNLNSDEWMQMLKHAEGFPHQITTTDMLKKRNPLISISARIKDAKKRKHITGFETYADLIDVGEVEHKTNILELVTEVKKVIDKYIDGNDDSVVEPEPITPPKEKRLVPVGGM
jgi:hypothetical protein